MALLPISLVFCRTDLTVKQYYNWDPSADQSSPSSKGYHGHLVSKKKIRHVFFKLWGSNLSPFWKYDFKELVLDLLAPICKREKCGIHSHGFFPPEVSLPALDGSVDRLSTKAFLSLARLSLSLTDTGDLSVPPGLPTKVGWRYTRVDLMASQTDVQFLTIKTFVWFSFLLWCHLGWSRVAFLGCFPS